MTALAYPDFTYEIPAMPAPAPTPEPEPVDPVAEAIRSEERFARRVARYAIPAVVWAMIVVGLVAGTALEPVGFGLLWIAGATMIGSCTLTFLTSVVTREPRDD